MMDVNITTPWHAVLCWEKDPKVIEQHYSLQAYPSSIFLSTPVSIKTAEILHLKIRPIFAKLKKQTVSIFRSGSCLRFKMAKFSI